MRLIFFFLISFLIASCVNDGNKPSSSVSDKLTKPLQKREATSELAERLYANFHNEPKTQAQKDENALIDYAVEKNLNVKRTASGLYYVIHKREINH